MLRPTAMEMTTPRRQQATVSQSESEHQHGTARTDARQLFEGMRVCACRSRHLAANMTFSTSGMADCYWWHLVLVVLVAVAMPGP